MKLTFSDVATRSFIEEWCNPKIYTFDRSSSLWNRSV